MTHPDETRAANWDQGQPPDWLAERTTGAAPLATPELAIASQPSQAAELERASGEEPPEWLDTWQAQQVEALLPLPGADLLPDWLREAQPTETGRGLPSVEEPAEGTPALAPEPARLAPIEPAEPVPIALPPITAEAAPAEVEGLAVPASAADAEAPLDQVPDWVRRLEATIASEGPPPGTALDRVPRSSQEGVDRARMAQLEGQLLARPRDYRARVELARLCRLAGDWEGAIAHYEELIASRKLLPAVVHDLTGMLEEGADRVQVYRLLGDAYTELGEDDRAMDMYRAAREALKELRRR